MSAIVQWCEHSLALSFFGIGMKTDLFQFCGHCFWCAANRVGNSKKRLGHVLWWFLGLWSHTREPLLYERKAGCPGPSVKHIAEVGLLILRVSFTSLNVWKFKLHGTRASERRYPMSEVRSDCEEIPNIQGKELWLGFAGAAVKRYPMYKVRANQVRW